MSTGHLHVKRKSPTCLHIGYSKRERINLWPLNNDLLSTIQGFIENTQWLSISTNTFRRCLHSGTADPAYAESNTSTVGSTGVVAEREGPTIADIAC
jgi:hypothetical protein